MERSQTRRVVTILAALPGLACALTAMLAPAAAQTNPAPAPNAAPVRLMPGEVLKIENVRCGANPPVFTLDNNLDLTPAGSGTTWSVTLPANLQAPKIYSVKLRCTPGDPKETPAQVAVLDLLPLIPTVTGVRPAAEKPGSPTPPPAGAKPSPRPPPQLDLKNRLSVEIRDLKPWREQSAANAAAELHLFLADLELKNLAMAPAGEIRDADGRWVTTMTVTLEIDDKDPARRKAWIQVLQSAFDDKAIRASAGPAGGQPFSSEASLRLRVFPAYTWLVVAGLVAITVVLVVLGKKSNLLRDVNGTANPPYSLARHQMAVWLLVIVGSYLYVWLITGSAAVSTTALILMGISGATGLMAVTMDNSKRDDQAKTRASLQAERDSLQHLIDDPGGLRAQLAAAAPGSPEAAQLAATLQARAARLAEVQAALAQLPPPPAQSRRWYLDLLSDDNGVSFHRLQMAIWTVVLVCVFIRAVYADVVMPEFDATMLGLMGIASGTYLGFKFPGNK